MKKYIILAILLCVSSAQAGLNLPPLTNPSFEDPALASGMNSSGLTDWYDSISQYTLTQDDAIGTHPDTPYGDNWAELGKERWMYQQIGTYEENLNIDVSFLLGSRTDKNNTTVYVSLLVGGDPAEAADVNSKYYTDGNPLLTTVGALQVDSKQVTNLPSAGEILGAQVTLSTKTGHPPGDPLWLQFHVPSVTSRTLIDNVTLTSRTVIYRPLPTISSFTATNLGTTIELAWQTTDADTLSIDHTVGDVTGMTSTQIVNTAVAKYTLTAINAEGTNSASATVQPSATSRPMAASGPNVIFILADDWGWTDHSHTNAARGYQSLFFQTPNFNRLADSGVAFTSAYAQPNCAPTRAALLTGQYSCRTGNGVYNVSGLSRSGNSHTTYTTAANQGDEHINGDEQTITIGEAFINSGYVTAHFGKYHAGASSLTDPTYVLNQGFDFNYGGKNDGAPGAFHALDTTPRTFNQRIGPELHQFAADYDMTYISNNLIPYANGNDPTILDGTRKHLTDAMADAFISFMDDHQEGSMSNYPVYAQVHFYAVHSPIQPRADLLEKYAAIEPPPGSTHSKAAYAALIEGMDHSLGRIINYLNDPNGDGNPVDSITTNTLLVFCSDNGGTHDSNAPLREKKGTHFEGGIRIPSVISMPGTIPTNTVSDTLIHVVDFYPTMLDFAGGVYPDVTTHPLDGVSLYNHLLDPDNTERNRKPIFYHFPGYMDTRAYACSVIIKEIGDKRFKYIYSYDPYYRPFPGFDQFQLYNITDDISETVNLLDYIDLENTNDTTDPSTSEEYWNYILYKKIGDQLAAELNNWIIGDPDDATWNPIHVTYKDTYPGIDPGQAGNEVAPPPASIPELEIPEAQKFQVLDSHINVSSQEFTLIFNSEVEFNYAIQTSTNLMDWTIISSNIVGQAGATTNLISDPSLQTEHSLFYRAVLLAE